MILHLNLHASECFPIKLYEEPKKNQDVKIKITSGTTPVNVKILSHDSFSCERQGEDGHSFYADQYLTFELNIESMQQQLFYADIEIYSLGECIGKTTITACHFNKISGNFVVPLLNPSTSRISAEIRFDYLIIKRWEDQKLTDDSCTSLSTSKEKFVYMGHRGYGKTSDRMSSVLENTIPSLCAAQSDGASFVELDVILTKDLVPIVFHDFHASVFAERKDGLHALLQTRVQDLTLHQLKELKMDFARSDAGTNYTATVYNTLFPTLQEVLDDTPPSLGLFIEVKYPYQERETKLWEVQGYFDQNIVVDRILDVTMHYKGDRAIMFCSFDPEICILLNCKQNRFPVVMITCGENVEYREYMDIRNRTRKIAVNFALMNDLLGVSLYGDPLVNNSQEYSCIISALKSYKKCVFSWGPCNNNSQYVQWQKSIGVTGIITDCLKNLSPNVSNF